MTNSVFIIPFLNTNYTRTRIFLACAGRSAERLFHARQCFFQPQNGFVQKAELACQPGQLVDENKRAHEKQQSAAKHFDGVEILSEALIKLEKLSDAEGGQQERYRQTCGVNREKQNPPRNRIAGGGERKHRRENRSDTRRPSERECEPKEE